MTDFKWRKGKVEGQRRKLVGIGSEMDKGLDSIPQDQVNHLSNIQHGQVLKQKREKRWLTK